MIGLVIAWLLAGLFASLIIRHHDDEINLLTALFIVAFGPLSLLMVFILWLSEIEI